MFAPLHILGLKAKWHTRRVRIAVLGGVLLGIGGGFLLSAIWIFLATEFSALIANSVLAVLFIGAGLIVYSRRDVVPEPRFPSLNQQMNMGRRGPSGQHYPALMEAFLFGVATYSRMRDRKRR